MPQASATRPKAALLNRRHQPLCGIRFTLATHEDAQAFQAMAAELRDDLAPVGQLEQELVAQAIQACWAMRRLDRLEAQLWSQGTGEGGELALERAFALGLREGAGWTTLIRYRQSAQGELRRALALLERLRAGRLDASLPADPGSSAGKGSAEQAPAANQNGADAPALDS